MGEQDRALKIYPDVFHFMHFSDFIFCFKSLKF